MFLKFLLKTFDFCPFSAVSFCSFQQTEWQDKSVYMYFGFEGCISVLFASVPDLCILLTSMSFVHMFIQFTNSTKFLFTGPDISSVRVFASGAVGHGFESRPRHTKDVIMVLAAP